MRNTEKILNLLSQVIELARGITPAEGEIIFRSNIFIDVMSAVEQGNKGAKVSLAEKIEKQLGIFGTDPLCVSGVKDPTPTPPLGKGRGENPQKCFYITFNEHSRWYGYYAEIWADNNAGAAQKAGEQYGWLDWNNVQVEKPKGLELITHPGWLPVHEVVDTELEEILEEAGKVIVMGAGDPLPAKAVLPLGKGETLHDQETKEERGRRLYAIAQRQREEYLRIYNLNPDGSAKRG